MTKSSGCAFGQVNRQMIIDVKADISGIKTDQTARFDKLDKSITELFNHQSNRVPRWEVAIITALCSLLVGLAVYTIVH